MRLVVAVRTKLREKTPAAQVTKKSLSNYNIPFSLQQNNKHTNPHYVSSSLPPSEFDDLEMCTSLSHQQDYEGAGGSWYAGSSNTGAYEMGDESASLHHLVQDLRSQLSRCHKVIRGLQLRVRSLSTTSDYASSLERTPRKVLLC